MKRRNGAKLNLLPMAFLMTEIRSFFASLPPCPITGMTQASSEPSPSQWVSMGTGQHTVHRNTNQVWHQSRLGGKLDYMFWLAGVPLRHISADSLCPFAASGKVNFHTQQISLCKIWNMDQVGDSPNLTWASPLSVTHLQNGSWGGGINCRARGAWVSPLPSCATLKSEK